MRRERKVEEKGPAPALDGIRTHDLSSACSQDVCSTAVLQPLHLIPKHFNSQNFLSRSKFLAKHWLESGNFYQPCEPLATSKAVDKKRIGCGQVGTLDLWVLNQPLESSHFYNWSIFGDHIQRSSQSPFGDFLPFYYWNVEYFSIRLLGPFNSATSFSQIFHSQLQW